jgi:hypothetical protein
MNLAEPIFSNFPRESTLRGVCRKKVQQGSWFSPWRPVSDGAAARPARRRRASRKSEVAR